MPAKISSNLTKEQMEQKLSRRQQEFINQNIKKYDLLEEDYIIGIDYGNGKDKNVMTTMKVVDGTFYIVSCEEF